MTDRYAVFGNPIGHSKSPAIHTAFARATGADLRYDARLAPCDGFAEAIRGFMAEGGRGANVTVPFKEEAYRLADTLSARAQRAGAVNTLRFDGAAIFGDNTDGAGLVRDLESNLGIALAQRRILLLGAGGAARGVVGPLLDCQPAMLHIANRTADKAIRLAEQFADCGPVRGGGYADFDQLAEPVDIIINATSASLGGEVPAVPQPVYAHATLAYDMMYSAQDTAFLAAARAYGLAGLRLADGLGMLVEQAAEAFFVWRGVRPATAPVLADLRTQLQS